MIQDDQQRETGRPDMAEKPEERVIINSEEYLTITGATKRFGKSPTTLHEWIKGGLLHSYRRKHSPRPMLIKTAELEALLDAAPIPITDIHDTAEDPPIDS